MKQDLKHKIVNKLKATPGRSAAIQAMCCECIFDQFQEGTWRKQVEECTSTQCPLYKFRPCTISGNNDNDEEES